jgi:hypothetical protein
MIWLFEEVVQELIGNFPSFGAETLGGHGIEYFVE